MNGRSGVGPGTFTDESGLSYTLGFTNLQGFVTRTITQAYLPAYNLVTDARAVTNHGGATAAGGAHRHTTDAQGTHSHGGTTGLDNADHTHTGDTDVQGDHEHTYARAVPGHGRNGRRRPSGGRLRDVDNTTSDDRRRTQHNFRPTAPARRTVMRSTRTATTRTTSPSSATTPTASSWTASTRTTSTSAAAGIAEDPVSPIAVVTKIIYAGAEAAIVTAADIATAPASIRHAPGDREPARGDRRAALPVRDATRQDAVGAVSRPALAMPRVAQAPPPGVFRNATPEATPGRWYDSNIVRFRGGQLQPIGGNVALASAVVPDLPRDMLTWHDNAGVRWAAFGTDSKLFAYRFDTQALYDITPAGVGPLDPPGALDRLRPRRLRRGRLRHGAILVRYRPAGYRRHHGRSLVDGYVRRGSAGRADAGRAPVSLVPAHANGAARHRGGRADQNRGVIVTDQRHVVLLAAGGDPRKIAW